MTSNFRTLNVKLTLMFLALGIVPLVALGIYAVNRANATLTTAAGHEMEVAALQAVDTIDRNLFERYGDVQAFAANPKAQGTQAEATEIIDFLTTTYGIYDLMLVVDLDGRVAAVNSIGGSGETVDSRSLIGTDVSDQEWFQVVASGRTPEGGTYYTDVERSSLVAEVYGDDRLTLPFTAPIFDDAGDLVGVWHNQASFERIVAEITEAIRVELVELGLDSTETQLLRSDGVLLVDADPDAVLSFDLAGAGLDAAQRAISGDSHAGFTVEPHARTGVEQINGYAASIGALGFPGYGWASLVRVDLDEATADAVTLRNAIVVAVIVAALVIATIGVFYARRLAQPIRDLARQAEIVAGGNFDVENLDLDRNDEVGDLANSFDAMTDILGVVGAQTEAIANRELTAPILTESLPGQLGRSFKGMIESLQELVGELRTSSNQLAGAAEELTAVSNSVGENAERTSN
ncbi:MAG: HAMP domain-containing protein, partial [Actinomycetota bacterium]